MIHPIVPSTCTFWNRTTIERTCEVAERGEKQFGRGLAGSERMNVVLSAILVPLD